MVDANGFHVPTKIPFGVITVGIALAAQFVAVVVWASNEHSERINLRTRFDEYIAVTDRRMGNFVSEGLARNREQDEIIKRLDAALVNMLRRLDLVEERQIQGARTVASFNELQIRLEGRLTAMESAITRLDEQQVRILKALDATYNLINEHLRVDHRGNSGVKNPDIWKGGK